MTEQKPAAEAHEEIRELESQHADEIARLRLTAEKRARLSISQLSAAAATLRTLLERLK